MSAQSQKEFSLMHVQVSLTIELEATASLTQMEQRIQEAGQQVVIDLNVRRKMSVGRSGVEHSGQKNLRWMFDITSTLESIL